MFNIFGRLYFQKVYPLYSYCDQDEAADSDTGQRLVGASRASTGMNYPFVVGYNLFSQNGENGDPIDYTACTGTYYLNKLIL